MSKLNKICKQCTKNCSRIWRGMCDVCYAKINPNAQMINDFTTQQSNVIIGSMLGDGHLRHPNNGNAALRIKRATSDRRYLEWEANIFNDILTNARITDNQNYDKRYDKIAYS